MYMKDGMCDLYNIHMSLTVAASASFLFNAQGAYLNTKSSSGKLHNTIVTCIIKIVCKVDRQTRSRRACEGSTALLLTRYWLHAYIYI